MGLVEVSQSVFIKLGDGDTVVAAGVRNAELIEGRAMLVRVHVRPDAGFTARTLRGVLTVSYPMAGAAPRAPTSRCEETKMLAGASDPEKLETTFNFLVPAAAVKPGARLAAAVYEAPGAVATGADPATPPRFPATGAADLAVRAGRMVLDVTMVPGRRRRAAWWTPRPRAASASRTTCSTSTRCRRWSCAGANRCASPPGSAPRPGSRRCR